VNDLADLADLVHRYADAVTRRDLDRWVDCWADDAVWTLRHDRVATGRDDILSMLQAVLLTLDGVVQHVLNGEAAVGVDGSTAAGRWHIQEHLRRTTGEPLLFLAHYEDTYVRSAGGWRFQTRTLVTHYQGPPDLSGSFTTKAIQERATT